ncbi:MAG TPA: ATP-binding protein [Chloroflexia bacterium]|nr:ATP-binding protein [Chloroflexia bacterium]
MDSLIIQADLDALEPVSQFVISAASLAELDETSSYKLRQAVDEIVTNIVEHGYAEASEPGVIGLQARIEPEALVIEIEDWGLPFDLRKVKAPDLKAAMHERGIGGLGIYLALMNVDHILYERVNDCNRNQLIMKRAKVTDRVA